MLTDIFANRYIATPMWENLGEPERRFIVQGFRMVSEQFFPYWYDGKENPRTKHNWISIHDKLSMELGLKELSPKYYSYQTTWNGKPFTQSGAWSLDKVCENFVCTNYSPTIPADRFIKERISFIEIAFREREEELKAINRELPKKIQEALIQDKTKPPNRFLRVPGSRVDGVKAYNKRLNSDFQNSVNELNERMRQAGFKLNYHNGFIQISTDELIEEQIEKAFWLIVNDDIWKNVDVDMKEAIDRRDNNDRDPAFYAARALESTIKIISENKGWTHGLEKGEHNYIDNLISKKNGSFITNWEGNALKDFFTSVRNPFGHGPGSEDMPELSIQQTNWAIETCMSWIKSLTRRM
jgi:hypothetical protein